MSIKPPKPPTDNALLKGFQKFEEGMNVWLAWYRGQPDSHDINLAYKAEYMWDAHKAYRELAISAQERIDAKKGKKDEAT